VVTRQHFADPLEPRSAIARNTSPVLVEHLEVGQVGIRQYVCRLQPLDPELTIVLGAESDVGVVEDTNISTDTRLANLTLAPTITQNPPHYMLT